MRRGRRLVELLVAGEHDEQQERAGIGGVRRLEVDDQAVDDALHRFRDPIDLGGADARRRD